MFTAGLSTLVFNANVLMRFDGYFILADAVDIPNLAAESTTTLKRFSRRWIVGESTPSSGFSGWRGVLVMTYGLAALLWRVSVCVCLAIAASTMFHGAGLVLSVLGIVIWIGTPAIRLKNYLQSLWNDERSRFYRAVIVGSSLCVLGVATVFYVPLPSRVEVPVMTRLAGVANVRAPASGFISAIHVADGDNVVAGAPLITLVNDELRASLRELEIQSQRMELELRHASGSHDEARCHVLRRSAESLEKRLADYRHRVKSLVIHAAQDGRVIARDLATRVGTYAKEGDDLMAVATEEDREWIMMIQPRDMEHVQNCVGRNIPVTTANRVRYQASIQRIQPRATDELVEPAMAAINGGPLATQTIEDPAERSSSRLLEPHFCGYLSLDEDARSVPIGTRMTADCGYQANTIASRLRSWVREMWTVQLTKISRRN
jgi:putative peptide zinc metalloprotease protein